MRNRHDPAAAHQSHRGLDPHQTIRRRRAHNRPIRLRANRRCAKIRGNRRARPRTGSARIAVQGVRILGLPAAPAPATAPASRSLWTTVESFGGFDPTSASDPAVVIILSAVSMLSLINTGIPCSGPRAPFSFLSRSEASARASASGFNSMTLFTAGPCLSSASIRAKYFSAIARAVYFPAFIPSCSSAIVISSNSNVGTPGKLSGRSRASTDSILITGATAAAKPPAKLLRRNALRPFSVFKVQLLS